jgi:hypothetical protein
MLNDFFFYLSVQLHRPTGPLHHHIQSQVRLTAQPEVSLIQDSTSIYVSKVLYSVLCPILAGLRIFLMHDLCAAQLMTLEHLIQIIAQLLHGSFNVV